MTNTPHQLIRDRPIDDDRYTDLRLALRDHPPAYGETPYGATKTAELDVQFSIDPSFGLTKERYGWYSNGVLFDQTHFTRNGGKIDIETSTTAGDSARIRSAFAGQYISHTLSEPGMGFGIPSQYLEFDDDGFVSLTHGEISAEIAQCSDTNGRAINAHGISFEPDATYAHVRSDDQNVEFVPQREWNIDPMNGDGPSGIQLTPQDGYVYQFIYTWYGQGAYILVIEDPETSRVWPMHQYVPDEGNPAVTGPNMPVQLTVENQGTAAPLGARLGGMQYATHGKTRKDESTRSTEVLRQTTGNFINTTAVVQDGGINPYAAPGRPLIAARRDRNNIDARKGMEFELENVTPQTTSDIYLYVWDEFEDAALTGGTYRFANTRNSPETKIEINTSATAYTPSNNAVLRGAAFVPSSKQQPIDVAEDATSRVPLEATVVVSAVLAPGSNNTDVQPAVARFLEGF